jgi:hypothetical protein
MVGSCEHDSEALGFKKSKSVQGLQAGTIVNFLNSVLLDFKSTSRISLSVNFKINLLNDNDFLSESTIMWDMTSCIQLTIAACSMLVSCLG